MNGTSFSKALKEKFSTKFQTEIAVLILKRDTPVRYKSNEDYCLKVDIKDKDTYFNINLLLQTIKNKDDSFCKKIENKSATLPASLWDFLFENDFEIVKIIEVKSVAEKPKPQTKATRNLSTFETIQALVKEKGYYDGTPESLANYTHEDIMLIKQYEGRGGIKGLQKDLTSTGALNEFYTPEKIARLMYNLAIKNGYKKGKILEPSVGIGRLINPFVIADENYTSITAFEVDKVSATICKLIYKDRIDLKVGNFESLFYTGNLHTPTRFIADYDLVVGNPPYEETKGYYIAEYKEVGATQYDQYFLSRGLDVLKPGGLLVMIIPSTFLRNERLYNPIKEKINQKATLLEAYRLPNDVFPNTGIGTDIVLFRKN